MLTRRLYPPQGHIRAGTKVILIFCWSAIICATVFLPEEYRLWVNGAATLICFICLSVSHPKEVFHRKQIIFLVLFLIILFLFQWHTQNLVWALGSIFQVLALVIPSYLLVSSTPVKELASVISTPLRWPIFARLVGFGFTAQRLEFLIAITLLAIPLLLDHWNRLIEAQQARGQQANLKTRLGMLIRLLNQIDHISVRISDAVIARGYFPE